MFPGPKKPHRGKIKTKFGVLESSTRVNTRQNRNHMLYFNLSSRLHLCSIEPEAGFAFKIKAFIKEFMSVFVSLLVLIFLFDF